MNFTQKMGILALSGVLAGVSSAQTLENVTAQKKGSGVEISISGQDLGQPSIIRTRGNRSYILQWNGKLVGKGARRQVDVAGVDYLWFGWYDNKPPKVRVQLWLKNGAIEPHLEQTSNGWSVLVGANPEKKESKTADPYKPFYESNNFEKLPPMTAVPTGRSVPEKTLSESIADSGVGVAKKPAEKMVSLDFTNTDVVLILKALASQAEVNIVTSPDVGGRVNVKLEKLPLTEALNFVTTIANVRYTKIGKTYLVTSSSRFSDAIRQVIGKLEDAGETRVIQLKSGEGKQIKAAALRAVPQLSAEGYYDLILPTEKISAKTSAGSASNSSGGAASAGVAAGGDAQGSSGGNNGGGQANTQGSGTASASVGATGAASNQGSSVEFEATTEQGEGKDAYVVVVASPDRLDEIVGFIKSLDEKIAEANSLSAESMATRVIPIYCPNSDVILDSVKSMIARDPKSGAFKVSMTSGTTVGSEEASKLLVITGPAHSLDVLENLARATDSGIATALGVQIPQNATEARKSYEVVELNWVEPLEAATELEQRVRGLSARLMPAPVDPNVKGAKKIGEQSSTAASSASGSATQGSSGDEKQGTTAVNQAQSTGSAATESKAGNTLEKGLGTEPMRLLLYGTPAQLAEAKQLLGAIDIEPKMVALEFRVMELSREDAVKIGIDWNVLTGGFFNAIRFNNSAGNPDTEGGFELGGGRRSTEFTGLGKLDQAATKTNLIARPNTIAMDGKPSNIFVGDTIRYVEQIQASQSGVTVITGKVDVGVTLNATPRVSADGTITMSMNPSLTILRGFTAIPNGGQLPQTSVRQVTTQFNMKSGETIALGGLIQDQDRKTYGGVPFLKDIPILGRLFGREDNQKIRSEVVFFVTAYVVDSKSKLSQADPREAEKRNPHNAKVKSEAPGPKIGP
jgi:type II secretory pathway component GspD/PulD (secretin)